MSVDVTVPEGATVYSVALSKPMGMVLEGAHEAWPATGVRKR